MRPTTRRAALLLAGALTLLGTGVASAATSPTSAACTDEVVDGAGVLSPADVTMLTQGSAPLAATTTLRLRTVTSVPQKDLNAYEKTLQISCGWASAANVRQPKLLVVMVDTQDRQMGIYPGPALAGTIDKPIWLSIEQHTMKPKLASANWEGGLQGGVYALNALINGGAVVASDPPVASSPAVATAARKTHNIDYAQIGLWGGVMVLWAVVGLVGRSRRRRRWKQSSAYLYDNIPYNSGHHGGWWGGGGSGGGSDGGGGGSSSDGGGGSSGF
jgi:uncharacterized membrane protein YgcG